MLRSRSAVDRLKDIPCCVAEGAVACDAVEDEY